MTKKAADLDSPWKEALEQFLPQFLAFLFPAVHGAIDWRQGYQSLDKELHQVTRRSEVGRRLADKLFKVWLANGEEAWLLIHIEVQGTREENFPERMYVYNYRIYDRFQRPVVSLAVLCDDDPNWQPASFSYNRMGCEVSLRFLTAKLLDHRQNEEALEKDANPFAAIVLAHLKELETRQAPTERLAWKIRLFKGLFERGLNADDIRRLFRLIDWMLALPDELDEVFLTEAQRFEEEQAMPYITSVERILIKREREEGLVEGREEGIRAVLECIGLDLTARFGGDGKRFLREVRTIKDMGKLRKIMRKVKTAKSLDDVRPLLG
jgi:hypothetical protein